MNGLVLGLDIGIASVGVGILKKEPMNISKENITSIATDLKKSEFFMGLVSTTAIFKNS